MLLLRAFTSKSSSSSPSGEEVPDGVYDPYANIAADSSSSADGSSEEIDDSIVLSETRKWVEGIIVDMKVCPFSSTADKAGMPIGGVSYPISHASIGEEVYEAFWEQVRYRYMHALLTHLTLIHTIFLFLNAQVLELGRTDEKELSTVLLLTPHFSLHSPGGYDLLADTLNGALTNLKAEEIIQLVFFHPGYAFRDGQDRTGGEGAAANYARRSPFPMINLLRTPQVRAAQKGLPTGSVYTTNERNLELVGAVELERMLEEKDWSALQEHDFHKHSENLWNLPKS